MKWDDMTSAKPLYAKLNFTKPDFTKRDSAEQGSAKQDLTKGDSAEEIPQSMVFVYLSNKPRWRRYS